VDPYRKIQWSQHGYCHGQIVIPGESGERTFSSEIEDTLNRPTYEKPQVVTVDQAVFKMTDEHVTVHDSLAVSQLRSCFLSGKRTDLKPIAVRFKLSTDVFPRDWQKVSTNTEATVNEMSTNVWYFLGYVPHSVEFTAELQVLCRDGVVRIAKTNNLNVHPDRRLRLLVLP
jgi:hypothetical protein